MIIKYKGYDIEATVEEVKALLAEEVKGPVTQTPPKKTNRINLDVGKIKAMYDAGWPVKDIASDMHVSANTITNRLKEEGVL